MTSGFEVIVAIMVMSTASHLSLSPLYGDLMIIRDADINLPLQVNSMNLVVTVVSSHNGGV